MEGAEALRLRLMFWVQAVMASLVVQADESVGMQPNNKRADILFAKCLMLW